MGSFAANGDEKRERGRSGGLLLEQEGHLEISADGYAVKGVKIPRQGSRRAAKAIYIVQPR